MMAIQRLEMDPRLRLQTLEVKPRNLNNGPVAHAFTAFGTHEVINSTGPSNEGLGTHRTLVVVANVHPSNFTNTMRT